MNIFQSYLEKKLEKADIRINGDRPWDIQIHNSDFARRVFAGGSLAFGESYMDGSWDSEQLDELINRILSYKIEKSVLNPATIILGLAARVLNMQAGSRTKEVAKRHYNHGNDFYSSWLDDRMVYTCGIWDDATNLNDAQTAKLDMICKKLDLHEGESLLDIGCGWGALLKFAQDNYGVKGIGINISSEQVKYIREHLPDVNVKEVGYQEFLPMRTESELQFDKIVSVGMFEAVGPKNYKEHMRLVNNSLKDDGIFLLHTIGGLKSALTTDPWIDKYIFPNGVIPSEEQIRDSVEGIFHVGRWDNYREHYDKTLMEWYSNFVSNLDKIESLPDFPGHQIPNFTRMWDFYLRSCAGSFRCGNNQLWQIVFYKGTSGSDLRFVPIKEHPLIIPK